MSSPATPGAVMAAVAAPGRAADDARATDDARAADDAHTTDDALPAAVLWDMDGTLVDTEPYWVAAERAVVEEHGGRWSDEFADQLVGNDLMVSAEFIRAHSPVTLTPVQIVESLLERVVDQVRRQIPWRREPWSCSARSTPPECPASW